MPGSTVIKYEELTNCDNMFVKKYLSPTKLPAIKIKS